MAFMSFGSTVHVSRTRMLLSSVVVVSAIMVALVVSPAPWSFYPEFLGEYLLPKKEDTTDHRRDPVDDQIQWKHYQSKNLQSSVQCVGENFGSDAWMYRSCKFRNLCWDVLEKDYIVFLSPQEARLQKLLQPESPKHGATLSTLLSREHSSMSLGFLHPSLNAAEREALRWFPRVLSPANESLDYVMISSPTVLVPYRYMPAPNGTQLVWDTLIPIFNILQIFGLDQSKTQILAMVDDETQHDGYENEFVKHSEMILGKDRRVLSGLDLTQRIYQSPEKSARYICASHAVAGIGMLSDRGWESNTWRRLPPSASNKLPKQAQYTHNHARGGLLLDFAEFASQKLQLDAHSVVNEDIVRIVYLHDSSVASSPFQKTTSHLQNRLSSLSSDWKKRLVSEEVLAFPNSPFEGPGIVTSHASKGRTAAICVSVCGAGWLTALFLRPGSSLILLCDPKSAQGGFLEYGYWKAFTSQAAYLRIHWLEEESSLDPEALAVLIESELMSAV